MTDYVSKIDGLLLTRLKIIDVPGGDVMHGMKCSDSGYSGFGEAYFSSIEPGAVKAWKRHRLMTLNLIVPFGEVQFVMYDDRENSATDKVFQKVVLSRNNYYRLTVPPGVWLGFCGLGESTAMLLNIADIEHSPDEVDRKKMNEINFDWGIAR